MQGGGFTKNQIDTKYSLRSNSEEQISTALRDQKSIMESISSSLNKARSQSEDKEEVKEIGRLLVSLGMRYEHVPKLSITKEQMARSSKINTKNHNKNYDDKETSR